MKFLQRAWGEIKQGENIDLYLIVLAAFLVGAKPHPSPKELFDEAHIAWAEDIPEKHFMDVDGLEVT